MRNSLLQLSHRATCSSDAAVAQFCNDVVCLADRATVCATDMNADGIEGVKRYMQWPEKRACVLADK